ncbi:MAG: ROK family protein [Bacteroidia bacterium]|nr:ROK family protein [Bacteroidia bacterium]
MKILGIDIGGSGIKGAIVDTELGELLSERHRIPTPTPSTPHAVAEAIVKLTKQLEWNGPVGCGFPSPIHNGVAVMASNISDKWIGVNVEMLFSQTLGMPVTVVNDADAAGLAEVKFGGGKGRKGLVMLLTIGTGIGSALIAEGKLVPNTELGHLILKGDIAEKYCSDSARKRDELSWKDWAKRFDRYLNHVNKLFYPDLFILGGGASKKFDKFDDYLTVDAPVVPAELLNLAGIIGAAIAAESRISG